MLERLRISNVSRPNLGSIDIPFFEKGRYSIRFIEGLNPVESTITTSDYAYLPGSYFQGAKAQNRNIVITTEFNPSWSDGIDYSYLRRSLASFMSPGNELLLEFDKRGNEVYAINGYVETHESDIFVENPASQISIVCTDPYFRGNPVEYGLPPSTTKIEDFEVANIGDVETGFELYFKSSQSGNLPSLTIRNSDLSTDVIDFSYNDINGSSEIEIDSRYGNKGIWATESGIKYSILDGVGPLTKWPSLQPGTTRFDLPGHSVSELSLKYTPLYNGV